MHVFLRALPLAFVAAASAAEPRPAENPGVSDYVRRLMTARILADAKPFEPPAVVPPPPAEHPVLTSDAVLMERIIVKSAPVRLAEPRRFLQLVPLAREMHGAPNAVGFTTSLFRKPIGKAEREVNFNILQGSGPGVDHGRDFKRVEIEFSFRW